MAKTNETITMKGNPLKVEGATLKEGTQVPQFTLTGTDMADVGSSAYAGKTIIIVAVPSLDTPVCSIETKRFNQEATALGSEVVVLAVSRDLPFAMKRWCGAEGVERVVPLSDYKHRTFGKSFGVELPDIGLLARAVFVVDKTGKVVHVEYVSEIAEEPDYSAAIAAAKTTL